MATVCPLANDTLWPHAEPNRIKALERKDRQGRVISHSIGCKDCLLQTAWYSVLDDSETEWQSLFQYTTVRLYVERGR